MGGVTLKLPPGVDGLDYDAGFSIWINLTDEVEESVKRLSINFRVGCSAGICSLSAAL